MQSNDQFLYEMQQYSEMSYMYFILYLTDESFFFRVIINPLSSAQNMLKEWFSGRKRCMNIFTMINLIENTEFRV